MISNMKSSYEGTFKEGLLYFESFFFVPFEEIKLIEIFFPVKFEKSYITEVE